MKNGIVWWKMVVGLQLDTSSVTLGNCLKNNKLSDHSWQSCHGAQHHRVSVIHLILIQVIKVSCMFSLWELIMWSFSLLRPLVKLVKPTITYFVTLLVCYEPDQGDYTYVIFIKCYIHYLLICNYCMLVILSQSLSYQVSNREEIFEYVNQKRKWKFSRYSKFAVKTKYFLHWVL